MRELQRRTVHGNFGSGQGLRSVAFAVEPSCVDSVRLALDKANADSEEES